MEYRRELGNEGERLAEQALTSKGFFIVERNHSSRYGEIDLIAERDGLYVFAEVRMRTTGIWGDPAESVMFSKQRKVANTAVAWLQRQRLLDRVEVRFDVLAVVGQGKKAHVEHIEGAFEPVDR